ncbi:PhoPQ-activated pathogenicity-like protein PqaA type [Aquirufa rosea]|uniref:PhoPQ-activated pathogenicity-like protein PqaA type n=2 Tax=Aquirufa rosea TaxID=2509241 RepID=A0A4Q1C1U8_9BACT|nr:PhoPQ-activated pathogenicity-like protein PqaA type [Aquirufa rosea]
MHSKLIKIIALILIISSSVYAQKSKILPETALSSYIHNGDASYHWEVRDSSNIGACKAYQLILTSQKWREYTWRHQLTIFVPREIKYQDAMLFISGGSNKNEQPNLVADERLWPILSNMADKNKAIVSLIRQVPNQPLYGDKTEDELISYTLHQFKETKDYTWPLLFPMVKSAVRGMDAVQEFSQKRMKTKLGGFVISGFSKRGWTTWLSAAIDDPRVKAIGPMVIDMLNMPATLDYQFKTYGEYSIQIQDYVNLGIPQGKDTPDGKLLTTLVDPFSYRAKLKVPKTLFIGTNDEYWTVDAIKHYWDQIPGKNMIHYVPNAGHDLAGGKQAFEALSGFFANTIQGREYPVCTWNVVSAVAAAELSVNVATQDLLEATLWETTSMDKDFRNNLWLSSRVKLQDLPQLKIKKEYPKKGFQAFFLDLKYKDASGGSYTISTRVFVTDTQKII